MPGTLQVVPILKVGLSPKTGLTSVDNPRYSKLRIKISGAVHKIMTIFFWTSSRKCY